MSGHLPECPVVTENHATWGGRLPCFCPELRACEQRIHAQEALKRIEAHKQGVAEGIKEGRTRIQQESKGSHKQAYRSGYAAGVQAARDAAEIALLGTLQSTRDRVLAAIDALKGE